MKKIICLRDDDTNYFTSLEELKEGYGEIWGKYPITLATIPFVHGSESKIMEYDLCPNKFQLLGDWEESASVEELTLYHKVHPIGENIELISELKKMMENGTIEIAQHGVHHKYNNYGAELKHTNVAVTSIKQGKDYLEKVFGTKINIMVPPSNTIDDTVSEEVSSLGMNLLCSGPIRFESRKRKILFFLTHPKDLLDAVQTKINGGNPLRRRQGLFISDSITFDANKDDEYIYRTIMEKLNRYGYYSMTTHYRLLKNLEYRERYINMVNRIAQDDTVRFVTASEYFEKAIKNYR